MGGCVVPTCNHRTDGKFKLRNITFHRFPKDPKRRTLWINSLNLDVSKVSLHTFICSKHFKKEDIDTSSLANVRIRPNALPIEHVNNEIVTSSDFQKESDAKMVKEITNVDEITITHVRSETNPTSLEVNLPLTQEKETMVDFEFIYNSPEKTRLRNRIKYLTHEYQTKIRKLHQSLRRKSNYIETLTSALDELKKERLLNDEQVEILLILL
ncbi:unnamed protein product [Lasius platythorax]|uniref:THAP-type domain-containing protein n=1 Tax=Lasius platythorax TaxID=488582 RepID=A0AAV2P6T3_9HYME